MVHVVASVSNASATAARSYVLRNVPTKLSDALSLSISKSSNNEVSSLFVSLGCSNGISRRFYCQHIHPYLKQQHQRQKDLQRLQSLSETPSLVGWKIQKMSARYHKNIARLYARYVLDMAMAAVAAEKLLYTRLDGSDESVVTRTPSDWLNWERKEWSQELYQSLGRNPIERGYHALGRIFQLSVLLAPMVVLYPLSMVSESIKQVSWKYSLWGIEQAGPTYIKLVQWATTRQDLFSPEFCSYFGKLRDETVGHSWNETIQIVQQELQINLDKTTDSSQNQKNRGSNSFPNTSTTQQQKQQQQLGDTTNSSSLIRLDPKPIGSGCIAQVYRGVLTQGVDKFPAGTEVAVKVQHPNIFHGVCCDFYIMMKVAAALENIPYLNLQYLSLYDTVSQFRDIMLPQLDLILESKHLRRFLRDFADDDTVDFPVPIMPLTSTRVLTETFVHGKPIMEYVTAPEEDRKELAHLGLKTTLKMIFVNDFLHGDLHPGNLLVSGSVGKYKLHLLDCGLVVEMGPEQHVNLVKVLGAFTRKDGELAGRLMVDTQSMKPSDGRPNTRVNNPADVELFVKGIAQIVIDDRDNNFIEKVGDYITDICYLACRRKVKLEPAFINAALAVEIMEGIATALDPNLNVSRTALPMVVQAELMHRLPKFHLW